MKAAVYTNYGAPAVVQIENIPVPIPTVKEVLVKIHAAAVTVGDARLRRADPFAVRLFFGLFRPRKKILGDGFSGEIVAIGKNVQKFKAGDLVFGTTGLKMGAHAEYITLPEDEVLTQKPNQISHETAAAVHFGGTTALYFLRKANIQPGQKVLIYGASGSVGSAAVQIAKYFGAEVTAVCSARNAGWVKSLGADYLIDYATEDFAKNGAAFDVIFETINQTAVSKCFSVVKPGGKVILGAALLKEMLSGSWHSLMSGKKLIAGVAIETAEELEFLKKMLENGNLQPNIEQVFPLEKIAAAHQHIDSGRKKGNLVIRMV